MKFVREPHGSYTVGIVQSTIFQGDAEKLLERLPSDFFRCCVTSPPYWGLRDYQADGQIGAENDPAKYVDRLVAVSPFSDKFYRIDQITDALSNEGEDFRENLLARIGINA